ncbi:hypothetical protein BDW66DRAFT_140521 [Aspergillus desertorum]
MCRSMHEAYQYRRSRRPELGVSFRLHLQGQISGKRPKIKCLMPWLPHLFPGCFSRQLVCMPRRPLVDCHIAFASLCTRCHRAFSSGVWAMVGVIIDDDHDSAPLNSLALEIPT